VGSEKKTHPLDAHLHEVLGLPSGVEDGSDGGEGEGDEEEEEGGDDAGRGVQSLLRCVSVDLLRLEDEHNSHEKVEGRRYKGEWVEAGINSQVWPDDRLD